MRMGFGCIASDTSSLRSGTSKTFAIMYDSLVASSGFLVRTYFAGRPLIFVVVVVVVGFIFDSTKSNEARF